ncbi:MAG: type II toxin-antitoxin system VapC family toxin [Deltaproteobacteria bacterium]|nr:type II toxin-antitoxin system VapC family toxin [Deltaproteobacteria bacterium]
MIIDSSALVAIALQEPGWQDIFNILVARPNSGIATPTLVETGIVLSARFNRDMQPQLLRMLHEFSIVMIPFGEQHWQAAFDAYLKFGKGRHLAALNFGDCISYATAYLAAEPLFFVGDDFTATDIEVALIKH